MRNSSFFQKLTGSLRLSDDDLNVLNDTDTKVKSEKPPVSTVIKSKPSNTEVEEIIEEVDDPDFEIPEDAEIETIEEVIEDDSIDHEEVEEYYEEVIDEDEPGEIEVEEEENDDEDEYYDEEDSEESDDEESEEEHSIYGNSHQGKYDDEVEVSKTHGDYPVFKVKSSKIHQDEEKEGNVISVNQHEEVESTAHELPVDVFEMHNEIVVRVLVPGITPENLKVSITRNHVSLACSRPAPDGIKDSSYFEREIPYGVFNRMIQLPSDVDVEHAEAVEKYGLLIIRLPKVDIKKVQELKIKSV